MMNRDQWIWSRKRPCFRPLIQEKRRPFTQGQNKLERWSLSSVALTKPQRNVTWQVHQLCLPEAPLRFFVRRNSEEVEKALQYRSASGTSVCRLPRMERTTFWRMLELWTGAVKTSSSWSKLRRTNSKAWSSSADYDHRRTLTSGRDSCPC